MIKRLTIIISLICIAIFYFNSKKERSPFDSMTPEDKVKFQSTISSYEKMSPDEKVRFKKTMENLSKVGEEYLERQKNRDAKAADIQAKLQQTEK